MVAALIAAQMNVPFQNGTMHNANRMTSTELAGIIAAAAADKKARDVVILDIRGKTTIADYLRDLRG